MLGICMLLKVPLIFQPFRQVLEVCSVGEENTSMTTRVVITVVSLVSAGVLAVSAKNLSWIMGFVGSTGDILINFTIPGLLLWEVGNRHRNPLKARSTKVLAGSVIGVGLTMCIVSLIGLF